MKSDIDMIKKKASPILKEAGVTRSSVFGSYARGENKKNSDIDLLIDFPRGKGLFEYVDLQDKLTEAIGRKVDLVTYDAIHPLLRDRILAEQVQIL